MMKGTLILALVFVLNMMTVSAFASEVYVNGKAYNDEACVSVDAIQSIYMICEGGVKVTVMLAYGNKAVGRVEINSLNELKQFDFKLWLKETYQEKNPNTALFSRWKEGEKLRIVLDVTKEGGDACLQQINLCK